MALSGEPPRQKRLASTMANTAEEGTAGGRGRPVSLPKIEQLKAEAIDNDKIISIGELVGRGAYGTVWEFEGKGASGVLKVEEKRLVGKREHIQTEFTILQSAYQRWKTTFGKDDLPLMKTFFLKTTPSFHIMGCEKLSIELLHLLPFLPEQDLYSFAKEISQSMLRLQQLGILHGDVKPDNLMARRVHVEGRDSLMACWIDLGLASFDRRLSELSHFETPALPSYKERPRGAPNTCSVAMHVAQLQAFAKKHRSAYKRRREENREKGQDDTPLPDYAQAFRRLRVFLASVSCSPSSPQEPEQQADGQTKDWSVQRTPLAEALGLSYPLAVAPSMLHRDEKITTLLSTDDLESLLYTFLFLFPSLTQVLGRPSWTLLHPPLEYSYISKAGDAVLFNDPHERDWEMMAHLHYRFLEKKLEFWYALPKVLPLLLGGKAGKIGVLFAGIVSVLMRRDRHEAHGLGMIQDVLAVINTDYANANNTQAVGSVPVSHLQISIEDVINLEKRRGEEKLLLHELEKQFQEPPFYCVSLPWMQRLVSFWQGLQPLPPADPLDNSTIAAEYDTQSDAHFLRQGLQNGMHFTVVPSSVWTFLKKRYGAAPAVIVPPASVEVARPIEG